MEEKRQKMLALESQRQLNALGNGANTDPMPAVQLAVQNVQHNIQQLNLAREMDAVQRGVPPAPPQPVPAPQPMDVDEVQHNNANNANNHANNNNNQPQ